MRRAIRFRAKEEESEHSLQVRVLKHLTFFHRPNVFAFAIPNAARRSPRLAAIMKAEGLMAGVADLCILLPAARVAWLELKEEIRGVQSIKQEGFQARCRRLDHPYCVARTFDEAIAFLTGVGALR